MDNRVVPSASEPRLANLAQTVFSALAWHGIGQLASQAISWASTLIVIRLLDPGDYGLLAMAMAFFSFVTLASDLGIGSAIVQAQTLTSAQVRQIHGYVLLFNGAAWLVTFFGAGLIATFFREPRLVAVLQTLSLSLLMLSFYIVPQSLLMRDLAYREKARVDLAAACISPIVTLGLAVAHMGVWSLVLGALAGHVVKVFGYNRAKPGHLTPGIPRPDATILLRFGALITVDRVLWWLYSSIDVIIAGRLLGKEILGFYSIALTLASLPIDKVMPTLVQVSFSTFSRIQEDRARLQRNLLRAFRVSVLFVVPVSWGMAVLADDAILLFFGQKWAQVTLPFPMICAVLPLRAIWSLLAPALFAIDRTRVNIVNMAIALCGMSLAFGIGANLGLVGLGWAWLLGFPPIVVITTLVALRALDISAVAVFQAIWRSLLSGLVMTGAAVGVQRSLPSDVNAVVALLLSAGAGALAYGCAILLLDRAGIQELRQLIRR
jgi:teichuronic acid exporter